ncbi:MAG: hypothetical protein B7Y10_11480, partial [Sphingomonadales bacterium 24-56-14]
APRASPRPFWRWAIWKLFEAENAPQKGVIAFITNRKFLTGWPYAGLRKMMREQFDEIEVIDLRGDVRAGTRGNVDEDQGVFNIMVGTCITIAITDGSKIKGALAKVRYFDSWSEHLYKRTAKCMWLNDHAANGEADEWINVDRTTLDDFRPEPFQNGEWLSLRECFSFASSGLESKRDHIVYDPSNIGLAKRLAQFLSLDGTQADEWFNSTGMNPANEAQNVGFDPTLVRIAGYRPLDRQFHYPHKRWNDRLRTQLALRPVDIYRRAILSAARLIIAR